MEFYANTKFTSNDSHKQWMFSQYFDLYESFVEQTDYNSAYIIDITVEVSKLTSGSNDNTTLPPEDLPCKIINGEY